MPWGYREVQSERNYLSSRAANNDLLFLALDEIKIGSSASEFRQFRTHFLAQLARQTNKKTGGLQFFLYQMVKDETRCKGILSMSMGLGVT